MCRHRSSQTSGHTGDERLSPEPQIRYIGVFTIGILSRSLSRIFFTFTSWSICWILPYKLVKCFVVITNRKQSTPSWATNSFSITALRHLRLHCLFKVDSFCRNLHRNYLKRYVIGISAWYIYLLMKNQDRIQALFLTLNFLRIDKRQTSVMVM